MLAASSKHLEPLDYARGFSKNNRTTAVRRLSSMYLSEFSLSTKNDFESPLNVSVDELVINTLTNPALISSGEEVHSLA